MSQKSIDTERRKPRAMPVETIITRFKSAQQKLEKEKSKKKTKNKLMTKEPVELKKSTEIIESKVSKPKKTYKSVKNVKKVKNNEVKIDSQEYYPTKLKRKVLNARRFLAPKHNFKIICGTKSRNKRKLHTPQRDSYYSENDASTHKQSELSIIDMVRLIEESDSLDDDDLLEILTCPSPVWWEEPPDGYIEEALFSEPRPEVKQMSVKNQLLEEELKKAEWKRNQEKLSKDTENTNISDSFEISVENRDRNFINKRSKLEILLGDIKNMSNQKPTNSKKLKGTSLIEDTDKGSGKRDVIQNISKSRRNESNFNNKIVSNFDVNDRSNKNTESTDIQRNSNTDRNISKEFLDSNKISDKTIDFKNKVKTKNLLSDKFNKYIGSKDDIIIIENENDVQFNNNVSKNNTNCTVLVTNKMKKRRQRNIENKIDSDSDIEIIEDLTQVRQKRNSDCTDEDLSEFRDDEVLTRLENLDIPIKDAETDGDDAEASKKDLSPISAVFYSRRDSAISNTSSKAMTEEYLDLSLLDDDENDAIENNKNEVCYKTNLDDLQQNDEIANVLNCTISKIDFLYNLELCQKINTSNRNNEMKSTYRRDMKKTKKSNTKFNDKKIIRKKSTSNKRKTAKPKSKLDSKEYSTYKISDNSRDPKKNTNKNKSDSKRNKFKRNIKSYYKCKKIQRKNSNTFDLKLERNNKMNESIVISETDKIKYCFKCSSIFDSAKCNYCLRRNSKRKSCDYACDRCGLNFFTKQEIIKHLIEHNVENIDKL